MKILILCLSVLFTTLIQARPGDRIEPDAEMIKFRRGFNYMICGKLELPVQINGVSFVVQKGKMHPGIWAWRGSKFVVLTNMENPDSDVELDRYSASCQVSLAKAPPVLEGAFGFGTMMLGGYMQDGKATLYTAKSASSQNNFINCLAPEATEARHTQMFARDLEDAWGDLITEIQER